MKNLVLASASPRRQALLRQIGIPFEIISEDCDESIDNAGSPEGIVTTLAQRKADNVCAKHSLKAVIITADTIVWQDGKSFGKPTDEADAFSMLQSLRGKRHHVYTGVCVTDNTGTDKVSKTFADCTEVHMRNVSDDEIRAYIAAGEPFGKAGAYAIQEKGAYFVEKISGDYNTIVGLPLIRVCLCLRDMGFDVTDFWTQIKNVQ